MQQMPMMCFVVMVYMLARTRDDSKVLCMSAEISPGGAAIAPLYLHGLPGGPEELELAGVSIPLVNRAGSEDEIAARILQQAAGKPLYLIGFSLGAALALRLAPLLRPAKIDLIAPAAPLELGDFLPQMAGAPVFKAARRPWVFRALTQGQATAWQLAPKVMLNTLFASAPPADRDFLTPDRRAALIASYRTCLTENRAVWLREVQAYVRPWSTALPLIPCPVTIWHGTADTWSPFAMAGALARALPDAQVMPLLGLGHYTALCHALPRIVDQALP